MVLDTNAWLDLYVFADAGIAALAQALRAGRVRALRSDRTDAEIAAVLQRPAFAQRPDAAARDADLLHWARVAQRVDASQLRPAPWICRDPDDQKFLELACAAGAGWLLSKDRALLDLGRRARAQGLRIVPPASWDPGAGALPQR